MNGNDQQDESQFERLKKNKFTGSEVLGGKTQESSYKSSTEQQRFSRQLERDLGRSSNKSKIERGEDPSLSQSTLRKMISDDTSQWARSIYNQKLSQNSAVNNVSSQNTSQSMPTTQSFSSGAGVGATGGGGSRIGGSQSSASASVDTLGSLPLGSSVGDLLYWDGEEWVLFTPSGENKFFYWDGSQWQLAESIEFDVCENSEPKKYKIPAIEVQQ